MLGRRFPPTLTFRRTGKSVLIHQPINFTLVFIYMTDQGMTKKERQRQRRAERIEQQSKAASSAKKKKGLTMGVVVVLALAAVFAFVSNNKGGGTEISSDSLTTEALYEARDHDHVKGNPNANVTLVEYGDFQCPACASYHPVVAQMVEKFPDTLKVIYRHYPLERVHPHAVAAARAAEAAGKQGKFWEMHDLLFERQNDWSRVPNAGAIFEQYAESLDLDMEQYAADLKSRDVKSKVDDDQSTGNRLGVQGTPWFFLNGQQIRPGTLDEFETLIQAAVDNAPLPEMHTHEEVHVHADFAVYVDGFPLNFAQDKYMSPEGGYKHDSIHLHDGVGNIIHRHAEGITLGQFFESIGMRFDSSCFVLDTGEEFCADSDNALSFLVNGLPSDSYGDYVIEDLDRILISYGDSDPTVLAAQVGVITDEACIYSEKCPERGSPPEEGCVGGLGSGCTN